MGVVENHGPNNLVVGMVNNVSLKIDYVMRLDMAIDKLL